MNACARYFVFVFLFTITHSLAAQVMDLFPHTETLAADAASPPASIEDVSWIAGYWHGEIWGGTFEEVWSQPSAGSMAASFKFAKDNKVKFYELMVIREQNQSLILQLKHFGQDLKGWEEKNQTVDFKLVRLAPHVAYFDGYTYKLINKNLMHVYVVVDSDGEKKEVKFVFNRRKH